MKNKILPLTILERKESLIKTSVKVDFIEIKNYSSQKCLSYSYHRPISKINLF
jgi:hypothetical protein